MDYSMYEAILTRRMWLYGGICVLFAIGLLVCLLLIAHTGSYKSTDCSPRRRLEERIAQWTMYVLVFAGLVVCIWLGGSTVWKCSKDIKHQSYIVWEGEFTVIQDGPTKSIWYLPDETGVKLEGEALCKGRYSGTVVYAEHSGLILEYHFTEEL